MAEFKDIIYSFLALILLVFIAGLIAFLSLLILGIQNTLFAGFLAFLVSASIWSIFVLFVIGFAFISLWYIIYAILKNTFDGNSNQASKSLSSNYSIDRIKVSK